MIIKWDIIIYLSVLWDVISHSKILYNCIIEIILNIEWEEMFLGLNTLLIGHILLINVQTNECINWWMSKLHQPLFIESHGAWHSNRQSWYKVYQEYSLSHRELTVEEERVTRKRMVCYAAIGNYNIIEPIRGHQTLNPASLNILMLNISVGIKGRLITYTWGNLKIIQFPHTR